MPPVYSGALQPKKKGELQVIADALSLATTGTKDDIQTRIKEHLDAHDLSDDPQFGGLYVGKRKTRKEDVAPASLVFHLASSLWHQLITDPVIETMHLLEVMMKPPEQSVARAQRVARFPYPHLLPIRSRQKYLLLHPEYLPRLLQLEISSTQLRELSPLLRPTRTRLLG